MASAIGTFVGPCEVKSLLGKDGMGEVYRTGDAKLERDLALKILPDLFCDRSGAPGRAAVAIVERDLHTKSTTRA